MSGPGFGFHVPIRHRMSHPHVHFGRATTRQTTAQQSRCREVSHGLARVGVVPCRAVPCRAVPCRGSRGVRLGDLKIALRGGGGGVTWTPAEGGRGGGLENWGSVSGPLFCVRTDVGAKGTGTQKFWPEKVFSTNNPPPPHLSCQNDQRDVGIILSHRCWVDPPPPPHGRSGTPALNSPLPSRRPRREGGGGGNGLPCHPPRRAIFFPPWVHSLLRTAERARSRV